MAFNQADQTSAPGSFKGREWKTGPSRELLFQEIQQTPGSANAQTFCPELHKGRSSAPTLAKGHSRSGLSFESTIQIRSQFITIFQDPPLNQWFPAAHTHWDRGQGKTSWRRRHLIWLWKKGFQHAEMCVNQNPCSGILMWKQLLWLQRQAQYLPHPNSLPSVLIRTTYCWLAPFA